MTWFGPMQRWTLEDDLPSVPVYVVEPLRITDGPDGDYTVASHAFEGLPAMIAQGSIRLTGTAVSPVTWESQLGGFEFDLVGDISEVIDSWAQGTVLQLKLGFFGYALWTFETIALGVLQNIQGPGPVWHVECWDITRLLSSRPDYTVADLQLFSAAAADTDVAAGLPYTAGDPTLDVTDATVLERETGATGVVKVTPTSGSEFFLFYTGATGNQLTGVSHANQWGGGADANAAAGNTVKSIPYLKGHPLDITRRVLTSKDGTNGTYDVYPASWGYGLPDSLIDHRDVLNFETPVAVDSGAYNWEVIVEAAQDDGYTWLSGMLQKAGIFLMSRQGQISVRAAQDPERKRTETTRIYESGLHITDDDLEEVDGVSQEMWDSTIPFEYGKVTITTATSTSTPKVDGVGGVTKVATLPARTLMDYSVADEVWANEAAIQAEMKDRLSIWALRKAERLFLKTIGIKYMGVTPGDIVRLTTSRTRGRLRETAGGYDDRPGMVTEVNITPPGSGDPSVNITLSILPFWQDVHQ